MNDPMNQGPAGLGGSRDSMSDPGNKQGNPQGNHPANHPERSRGASAFVNPFLTQLGPAEDEIDLGALFAHLLDSWKVILGATLAVVFLAGVYAFTATPQYRADAMIQVEDKGSVMAGLKDLSDMFSGSSVADTEIQLIESRAVLGKVIDQQHLAIDVQPKRFPLFGGASARRWERHHDGVASAPLGMSRWGWGGEVLAVDRFEVPPSYEGLRFTLRVKEGGAYELVSPEGDVVLTGKVGELAKARIPGKDDSKKAREVEIFVAGLEANPGARFSLVKRSLADTLEDLRKSLSVSEQGKDTGIIGLQLKGTDPETLTRVLDSVDETYLKQNVEQKSAEADKTLKFIEGQLPELKSQLDEAESALNEYQSKTGTVDLKLETQAVLSRSVEVEKRLSELMLERTELAQRFTANHPSVVALDRQIAEIQKSKDALNQQMKKLPDTELKSVQLMRDVQVANDMYVLLLNKSQELKIVKSGTVGNVRIVDSAVVDATKPVWPKKGLILLGGLFAGLLLGLMISAVQRALERGIDDPDVLEEQLGLPVYATVPHSSLQKKLEAKKEAGQEPALLAEAFPKDVTVEAIRSLRTSLQFAATESPRRNVIMIAGLRPSVGKSFLSANLGAVIASGGQRVLMVDGDLRRGLLHKYLGLKREPGLSEVAAGRMDAREAVQETKVKNLWALSSGTLPPNPSELLLGEGFHKTLEWAAKEFDVVVVDAPPILAVTDSALIGAQVGVTLLTLKAGIHPQREIHLGLSRLQQGSVRVAGLVLNDMRRRSSAYSYGKYGYAYHYEYR